MAADDTTTTKDDDDLFGDDDDDSDGEDTDDLIAAASSSKQGPTSIAHSKTTKKQVVVSATTTSRSAADFDDNDDDSDDDVAGLFDSSDEEDEDDAPTKKKKAKSKKLLGGGKKKGKKLLGGTKAVEKKDGSTTADATKTQPKTMKERMEALANKKRIAGSVKDTTSEVAAEPKKKRSKNNTTTTTHATDANGVEKNTNDDEESVNSAEFVRTKEDDDFIDSDDDSVARKELYAEQHFDEEEDSDMEEKTKKKKSTTSAGKGGRKSGGGGGGIDKISLSDDEDTNPNDATNALKAAVRNMSKSKKKLPGLADLEEEGNAFLRQMEDAANADDKCIAAKTPAFNKLAMLPTVLSMLVRKRPETGKDGTSMVRVLLDNDLLSYCKRWVHPLPNGTLGNLTLRRGIIDCVATMTGELGVQTSDLKRSGFGRTVMTLYRHKNETPEMKKVLMGMIETWSRPIFQKSGNLRDLEGAQQQQQQYGMGSNDNSLVGLARARHLETRREEEERSSSTAASSGGGGVRGGAKMESSGRGRTEDDLERIIAKGAETARDIGNNRVRIPYSKGFQYSIRPESRHGNVSDSRNLISGRKAEGRNSVGGSGGGGSIMDEKRGALSKRMEAKSRKTNKSTQRSANVSVEGRVVK